MNIFTNPKGIWATVYVMITLSLFSVCQSAGNFNSKSSTVNQSDKPATTASQTPKVTSGSKPQTPATESPSDIAKAEPAKVSDVKINDGSLCISKDLGLDVVFVIDASTSMTPRINQVKANIDAFANKIKSTTISGTNQTIQDVRIGVISYVDEVADQQIIPLTSDMSQIRSQIAGLAVRNSVTTNRDYCEGGLGAVEKALTLLGSDRLSVVIVITDDLSHNSHGPFGSRYFSTQYILDAAKSVNNLLLFDASPSQPDPRTRMFGRNCHGAPAGTPVQQWDSLRREIAAAKNMGSFIPGSNMGAGLDSDYLLTSIPNFIGSKTKVCN